MELTSCPGQIAVTRGDRPPDQIFFTFRDAWNVGGRCAIDPHATGRSIFCQFIGKMRDIDRDTTAEQHCAFDSVAQFPHVAWPTVYPESLLLLAAVQIRH